MPFALTTCKAFNAGLGSKIDIEAPNISILSPTSGDYVRGTITLRGKASDDTGIRGISLTLSNDQTQAPIGGPIAASYDSSKGSWSALLDVAALDPGAATAELPVSVVVTATDSSDQARTTSTIPPLKLVFDDHKPTIALNYPNPSALVSSGSDHLSLSGVVPFTGSAFDIGLKNVSLTWQAYDANGENLVGTPTSVAIPVSSLWAKDFDTTGIFPGGYGLVKLVFTAEDSSRSDLDSKGNETSIVFDKVTVDQDQLKPTFSSDSGNNFRLNLKAGLKPDPNIYYSLNPGSTIPVLVEDANGLATTDGLPFVWGATSNLAFDILVTQKDGTQYSARDKGWLQPVASSAPKTRVAHNGSTYAISAEYRMSFPSSSFPDGSFSLDFVASSDPNARAAGSPIVADSLTRTVTALATIDLYPPVLSISKPATGSTLFSGGGSLQFPGFEGTAYDSNMLAAADRLLVTWSKDGSPGNGGVSVSIPVADVLHAAPGNAWTWTPFPNGVDSTGHADDGSYSFVFVAYDNTGKSTSGTSSFKIDTTPPVVAVNAVSGYVGGITQISGTASDPGASGSGLAKVQYQLGGTGGAWTDTATGNNWTGSLDLGSAAEGASTLYVRAVDNAGNQSSVASTALAIDRANPRATETLHGSGLIQTKSDLAFTGIADDAAITTGRKASSAALSYSKNGGAAVALGAPDGFVWNQTTGVWSYSLPAGLGDGLYVLTLTVTDAAGRQSTISRSVQIDATAPGLDVAAPVPNELTSSSSYKIQGTATDTGGVGFSGSGDVEYSLDGGTSWSALPLDGNAWSKTLDLGSAQGPRSLTVRATDKLGNRTTKTMAFFYDLAPPELLETGVGGAGNPDSASLATKGTFHFSGAASDSDALAASGALQVRIDGGTPVDLIGLAGGGLSGTGDFTAWNLDVGVGTGGLADGLHSFEFIATDVAGRTTKKTRSVQIDTKAPTSSISLPPVLSKLDSAYWLSGPTASFGGSSGDSGSGATGVAGVYYKVVAKGSAAPSFSTASWTLAGGAGTWSGTIALSGAGGLGQGEFSVYVAAVDAVGNVETPISRDFGVDQEAPTLGETHAATSASPGSFSLGGSIGDTNALASLSVTESKDGGPSLAVGLAAPATVGGQSQVWSTQTLPLGGAADGVYSYLVTVVDVAGKATQLNRVVKIDKTSPTVDISPLPAWISSSAYTIGGAADDGALASASGLAAISYQLDNGAFQTAAWNDSSGGKNLSGSWSATLTGLAESATHSLVVKAVDAAGNSTTLAAVNFGVDLGPPGLSVDASSPNLTAANAGGFTGFGGKAWDSLALAAPGSRLRVDYSKDGVAQPSASITVADLAHGAPGNAWTWSPFATGVDLAGHTSDGLYSFVFTATDAAGKTTTSAPVALRIDTAAPQLSVTAPATAAWISSASTDLVGGANDGSGTGVDGVYLRLDGIYAASGPTDHSAEDPAAAGSGWTKATGTVSWKAANFSLGAEGKKTLWVKAVDKAGNISSAAEALAARIDFGYDATPPSISETTASGVGASPVYAVPTKTDLELGGSLADTNALADSGAFLVSIDGADPVDFASLGAPYAPSLSTAGDGKSATWSLHVAVGGGAGKLADGSYPLVFTAVDSAGNKTSLTRTIVVDTTKPVLSIASPVSGDVVGSASLTISGVDNDGSGVGVQKVQYSLDGSTWSDANGKDSWSKAVDLGVEGGKTLYVKAIDALGTESDVKTVSFNLDLTPPSLDETGLGVPPLRRSGDIVLSGTASDSNGLKTWDDPLDGSAALVPYVEVSVDGGPKSKVSVSMPSKTWTYTQAINPNHSDDGDIVFTITATDVVDKVTTVSRTVTVDTSSPVLSIDGLTSGLNTSVNKVNGQVGFRFGADDSGVGLERLGGLYQAWYKVTASDAGSGAATAADLSAAQGWTLVTSSSSVFNLSYDTTATLQGDKDLWVAVRDAVGAGLSGPTMPNFAQTSFPLSIDQESDRPSVSFDNLDASAADNFVNGLGQNPSILLTVTDDDKVKVGDLQYRIDADNDGQYLTTSGLPTAATKWANETVWNSVEEIPSTDSSLAQAKIKLVGFPQGAFQIQVRARDTTQPSATWNDVYDASGNHSWVQSSSVKFSVDYGPPSIVLSGPAAGTYNDATSMRLQGTVSDALAVEKVRYTFDGVNYTTVFTGPASPPYTTTVNLDSAIDISASALNLGTGDYVLRVEATDLGGTTATQQVPITVDKTKPTATLLQPATHAMLNGAAVTVRGEATDNHTVGAVFVWSGKMGDPAPALPSMTGPGTYDAGGYTRAAGTSIWSTSIDTTACYQSGIDGYRIRVVAIDAIGNIGNFIEVPLTVDQENDRPLISFGNLSLSQSNRLALGNLAIIGTIQDDYLANHAGIQVSLDGGAYVDVSDPPSSDAGLISWKHVIPSTGIAQGLHHVKVRALDSLGSPGLYSNSPIPNYHWNETPTVDFYILNGPPALKVDAPTNGQRFKTSGFTVSGTTNSTIGIKRVDVWVDDNANGLVDSGEVLSSSSPLSADETVVPYSLTFSGLSDGTKPVRVTTYDSSDGPSVQDLSVVVDTTPPSASVGTPFSGSTVNGTVLVNGTASDNYQVAKVSYAVRLASAGSPGYPDDYTTLPANMAYAWNFSLDTTTLTNTVAACKLFVVVEDGAGNSNAASPKVVDFTVDQSTDRPRLQVTSITEGQGALQNLLPSDKLISGTVQDDDGVRVGSIQAKILSQDGSATLVDWTSVNSTSVDGSTLATWSYAVPEGDGIYQVRLRAYDINSSSYSGNGYDDRFEAYLLAGDSAHYADGTTFAIDTSNPDISATGPAQNSYTRSDVTFGGNASDASGIKKVEISYRLQGGSWATLATTGTESWSATLPVGALAEGVYEWQAVATDNFNKTNTLTRIFTLDKSAPTVAFSNPGAGVTVNGSLYVDGSATDQWKGGSGFQVSSVRIWMGAGGSPTPPPATSFYPSSDSAHPSYDASNWKELTGTNAWNFRCNTSSLADGSYTLCVVAVDNSGNVSSPFTRTIATDQSTNLPSLSFGSVTAGHYAGTIGASPTTTSFSDATLAGVTLGGGWYARFSSSGEMRKVVGVSGGTVTFTPPLAAVPSGGYELFPNLLGATATISGEISDDDGVDPASIQIQVDANGNGVYDSGEDFVGVGSTTVVGGKVQFSYDASGIAEGLSLHKFRVRATDIGETFSDSSQNVAPVTRTSADLYFAKDDAAPAAPTLSSFGNGFETKTTGIVGSNLNNSILLGGASSDGSKGRVGYVEVKVGAKAYAPATDSGGNFSTWSFADAAVGAAEGQISVQVRVTDVFGKQSSDSFVFNVDKTGPTVSIDTPAADGGVFNGNLAVYGSTVEAYRVAAVYYWVEDGADPAPALPNDLGSWNPASGGSSFSFNFNSTSRPDGVKIVKVVAQDNAGNLSSVVSRVLYFDQGSNKPVIRISGISSADLRGSVGASTLTSVTDSSLIGNADLGPGWILTFNDGGTRAVSAFSAATGQISWTAALAAAYPAGSSFVVSAPVYTLDSHDAGSISSAALSLASPSPDASWAVIFLNGSSAGVISRVTGFAGSTLSLATVPAVTDGGTTFRVLRRALLGPSAIVSGTITDDDGVDTTSVKAAFDLAGTGSLGAFGPVSTVTGSGVSVSFTQNLGAVAEGSALSGMVLQVSDIGDAAHGIPSATTTTQEMSFARDDGNPVLKLTELKMSERYGGAYSTGSSLDISAESQMASKVVNNNWSLSGTVSDGSLASLTGQVDSGTPFVIATGSGAWTCSFDWLDTPPAGGQGSRTITLVATDIFGNATTKTLPVILDSTEPGVSLASPADADRNYVIDSPVNGTVFMSGSNDKAARMSFWAGKNHDKLISLGSSSVTTWTYSFDSAVLRDAGASTYVSGDANSNGIEDQGEIFVWDTVLRVRAVDGSGNVTQSDYTVRIDNSTDRPSAALAQPVDGSYKSGIILASGTSLDDSQADDGVAAAYVRVDVNGDGEFSSDWSGGHGFAASLSGSVASSSLTGLTDPGLAGKAIVPGRWIVRFTGGDAAHWNNESRVISAYDSGTGSISWTANPLYYGASALAAPVAGSGFVVEPLYANEATWIPVDSLTNGVAWQVNLNRNGELNPSATGFASRMVKIEAKAVDAHRTDGAPSAPSSVFIDEGVPSIDSMAVNGGLYTAGLSTLVRGSAVPIAARLADDQGLLADDLKISLNGAPAVPIDGSRLYDWSSGAGRSWLLTSDKSSVVVGSSSATTATSLSSPDLKGSSLVGRVLYLGGAGSRFISSHDTTNGVVGWTDALAGLGQILSFAVAPAFTVDTASVASGSYNVLLRVTDQVNQTATATIGLSADNSPPTAGFNDDLVPQTSHPLAQVNGMYNFNGNAADEAGDVGGTYRYRVYGQAIDSGAVSGIQNVSVFFVKNVLGEWYAYAPQGLVRANQLVAGIRYLILSAGTTNFLGLGATSNAAGVSFVANASGTGSGSGIVMAANAPVYVSSSLGATEPTSVPSPTTVGAGSFVSGVRYRIASLGSTDFTQIGAVANTVGLYFISTGAGSGNGTARVEYSIDINSRTELGSNDDNANGDQDGIQESLRAKSGYDEWYADINTRVFPDGPLSVHYVVTDQAGNALQGKVSGQIVNNPPKVSGFSLHSILVPAASISSGSISLAVPAWIANDAQVSFSGSSAPTGLSAGTSYYVVNAGVSSFQLAAVKAGSPLSFSGAPGVTYQLLAGAVGGAPLKALWNGSVTLDINAEDLGIGSSINSQYWKLEVIARYGATTSGDIDLGSQKALTGWYYGDAGVYGAGGWKAPFASYGGGSPTTGVVTLDTRTDGFVDGDWYQLRATVRDADDNVATKDLYVRAINTDVRYPLVTIDDITQASLGASAQGHVEEAYRIDVDSADVNTATGYLTVDSVALKNGNAVKVGSGVANVTMLPSDVSGSTFEIGLGSANLSLPVRLSGAGLPAPLSSSTDYYIVGLGASSFQLSLTKGGAPVSLSSSGSGLFSLRYAQGTPPGGLVAGSTYYVVNCSIGGGTESFQLSASPAGAPLALSDSGGGSFRLFKVGALSGTLTVTGTAWDDVSVGPITVEISNDSGATWSSLGTAVRGAVLSGDTVLGYKYAWSFAWNTATVDGGKYAVAGSGLLLRATCSDGSNLAKNGPDQYFDVVPYVSKLKIGTKDADRTHLGKYPLAEDGVSAGYPAASTVTLAGYNFYGGAGTSGLVKIVNGAGTQAVPLNVTVAPIAGDYSSLTFVMDDNTTATDTPSLPSGWLVVTSSGVASGNNGNDNSLPQNKEAVANQSWTDQWSDDRYIQTWTAGTSFDQSSNPSWISMGMNPANKELYGSWTNLNDTWYAATNLTRRGSSTTASITDGEADPSDQTEILVDGGGTVRLGYLYDIRYSATQWGYLSLWSSANSGSLGRPLENIGNSDNPISHTDGMDEYMTQFRNPRMASVLYGGTYYTYISYYDEWAKCLKYAVVRGNNNTVSRAAVNDQAAKSSASVVDGQDFWTATPSITSDVGQWSSIALDTSGVADAATPIPVIMYYDFTNQTVKIARGKSMIPATGPAGWEIHDAISNTDPLYNSSGQYVTMKLDSQGNIHAVAYNSENGNLIYLFAPNVDGAGGAYVFSVVEVLDTSTGVGGYPSLYLDNDVPYVSYLYSALVGTNRGLKYAYRSGEVGSPTEWEYGIVPSTTIVRGDASTGRTGIVAIDKTAADVGSGYASWARSGAGNATRTNVAIGFTGYSDYQLIFLRPER